MGVIKDFKLPDLGEGLTESELVSWHVAVGDTVQMNQIIAEVETAKALVELPAPFSGVISSLYVEPGTTVQVGAPIMAFDVDEPSAGPDAAPKPPERNAVLVGYGPPVETGDRPRRRSRSAAAEAIPTAAPVTIAERAEPTVLSAAPKERPRSTPPVRKLARDLGVDLTEVTGTGPAGLITRDDVRAFGADEPVGIAPGPATSAAQRETRAPIRGVRKQTAAAMVASAFTAPHVTEFLTVDVTPTIDLLASLKARRAFADYRITMLTMVCKAMCIAAARTPSVNSHWDEAAGEILTHGYVNLGIAVATPRGLMVPNIKDADRLSLTELSTAIAALAETARAGKTTPADFSGGTMSLSNVGVFGVDAGTPILNPGEAVILAIGAIRKLPWEYRDEVALRQVMTMSLSFDHRLVDGEQGSRFLTDVGAILADPGMVLTMV
ncbi:MAG: dihydrolipoamide acetyltransferase family protein [Microbacteriaceae bacterium]